MTSTIRSVHGCETPKVTFDVRWKEHRSCARGAWPREQSPVAGRTAFLDAIVKEKRYAVASEITTMARCDPRSG